MKRIPESIDLAVLNASFGLATIFTLIPTKGNRENPKILKSVFKFLKKAKFKNVEDFYGCSHSDPDQRRLSRILYKNVLYTHKRFGIDEEKK